MKTSVVINASWAEGLSKAVVNLANGDTIWLTDKQLAKFGISVPQAMIGGELSYRFMSIGEPLLNGGVVTKADTLLDVRSVSFFSEELMSQAMDTNKTLFAEQAKKQLDAANDISSKNRTALAARLKAAKDAANAGNPAGNAAAAPAGAPVLDEEGE
jgi:hypothetical protein